MNPLITVAMPIYNVEKYVEKSLTSALNQTYDNLEILVIDDKGPDRSLDEVHRIISSHPRGNCVKIIDHIKNQGVGATRNTAIDHARGEYLFIMDSDDEITHDCIETLYAAMQETPVDFVVGSIDEVDDNGNLLLKRTYMDALYSTNDEILNAQYNPEWRKKGKSSPIIAPIWNRLYNLSFLRENKLRCIPYQKNEDLLFTFLLFLKADSCRMLSTATYKYNAVRPGSTMDEVRKGYSAFQLRQELDILKYYSSYIPYIKDTKGDVAKYILNSISVFGATTKRKLLNLKLPSKEKQETIRKIRSLTAPIKLSDMPKSIGSLYVWLNLRSPFLLDPLFQWILSVKSKFNTNKKQN